MGGLPFFCEGRDRPAREMPRPVGAPIDAFAALALNLFILFVAESSRGLVLPTLSAYVARLAGHDGGAGGAALAVSVFSAGRLVAAPLLGMIADAVPYKWLFFACAALSIGGHALFVAAAALPAGSGAVAAVLASRFLLLFPYYTLRRQHGCPHHIPARPLPHH